jgi:hypothetical protein
MLPAEVEVTHFYGKYCTVRNRTYKRISETFLCHLLHRLNYKKGRLLHDLLVVEPVLLISIRMNIRIILVTRIRIRIRIRVICRIRIRIHPDPHRSDADPQHCGDQKIFCVINTSPS